MFVAFVAAGGEVTSQLRGFFGRKTVASSRKTPRDIERRNSEPFRRQGLKGRNSLTTHKFGLEMDYDKPILEDVLVDWFWSCGRLSVHGFPGVFKVGGSRIGLRTWPFVLHESTDSDDS